MTSEAYIKKLNSASSLHSLGEIIFSIFLQVFEELWAYIFKGNSSSNEHGVGIDKRL